MKFPVSLSASVSLKTFWVLSAGIIILRFLFPRFEAHDVTAFLSWDVISHYLWLPAFFIHDDLGMHDFGWIEQMLRQYQPLIGYRQAILQTGTSDQIFSSGMGMAVMFTPFFIAGHLFAIVTGFSADGFSAPYQVAAAIGGLCWSIGGIWILRKILRSFFTDGITAITMTVMVVATGYLNFAAFDGASSENLLFTLYVILLLSTIRLLSSPSYGLAAGIGLVAGLIVLTRPFELALMVPWFLFAAQRLSGKHIHITAFALFFFLLIASWQVIYLKIYTSHFFFNTGPLLPGKWQALLVPYLALATIPAGYLIRCLSANKRILQTAFLVVCCGTAGWSISNSVRFQVKLSRYEQTLPGFFYRFDHDSVIPEAQRYACRTFLKEESELVDHPLWFNTRRIFTLGPSMVKMSNICRFSPALDRPIADFSKNAWIGLQARAKIYCDGPVAENSGNLVMTVIRDKKPFNWKGTPFNTKNLKPGKWNELTLNYIVDGPRQNDLLQAYVWYTGKGRIYVSRLTVTLFEIQPDE